MHLKLSKINFYIICLSVLFVQILTAQTRDEVTAVIQRLDREISRVEELARTYASDRSTNVIERIEGAKKLRNEAVSFAQERRFVQAAASVKAAYLLLDQAKKLILDGPLRRLRSQLEELLRRADDIVSRSNHQEARRLLIEARKNRDAAESAVQSVSVDKAVEHFRVGITLAQKAISLIGDTGRTDFDLIADEKRKFQALEQRAREVVEQSQNDRAVQIYRQAMTMVKSAEEAARNGNLALAKKLLNQSSLLLLRAIDLATGLSATSVNQTDLAFYRFQDEIERARPTIVESANPRAKLLFERAQRFGVEAENALQEGRNNQALRKLDLAQNMLDRAQQLVSDHGPRFSGRLAREIENTKNELEMAKASVQTDSPQDAVILLKMSQFALQKAEQARVAGFKRVALEATLAAQRFLTQAEKILRTDNAGDLQYEQVQNKLNQLDAAISESDEEVTSSANDLNKQLLQSAKDIRQLAHDSLQQGNYHAANEAIQVSFELLRKSLKNSRKD